MKKEIIKIILKVLIYALGLIGAYFGVSAFTACSIHREFQHKGIGIFHYDDTVHVRGSNSLYYEKWK